MHVMDPVSWANLRHYIIIYLLKNLNCIENRVHNLIKNIYIPEVTVSYQ
jgi:hypothetical protein